MHGEPSYPVLVEKAVRTKKAHYDVFALKDGTIYLVFPTRKPRKTKYSSEPKIDEDGICDWFINNDVEPNNMHDWARGAWHASAATCLNVKRIVRQQLERRLDRVEQEVQALRQQMGRVEQKIDQLLADLGEPGWRQPPMVGSQPIREG
jgi:hypothetical protein